jgi:hypothetical protein
LFITRVKQDFFDQRGAQGRSLERRETMKKIGAFTTMVLMMAAMIAGISAFCTEPAKAFAQGSSGKVLLIPREGYSQDLDLVITKEVSVMTKLLNNAGFTGYSHDLRISHHRSDPEN